MKLKTYQAYTMAEALAAVKRDLGASAVILNTRTFKRGGLLGIGRKLIVEVTATPAEQSRAAADRRRPRPEGPAQKAYAYVAPHAGSDQPSGPTPEDRRRTQRLAQAMAERIERERAVREQVTPATKNEAMTEQAAEAAPVAAQTMPATEEACVEAPAAAARTPEREVAPISEPAAATPAARVPDAAGEAPTMEIEPAARRFILTPASRGPRAGLAGQGRSGLVTQRTSCAYSPGPASGLGQGSELLSPAPQGERFMQEELTAIKTMVGQVLHRQTSTGGAVPGLPPKLFQMYLRLIAQDISEELADRIINDVRDELSSLEMEDEVELRAAVMRHLSDYIPVADEAIPKESPDDRPLTIALVGPTGVGKTTTLAKLAASFKLRHQKRVGLITADTYRIAAVEQLRTYANIIGLPLQVVLTPSEMRQAVHALSDCDVVLVDTAGRSQNDAARLDELRQHIDECRPHEVHLVLSSTASERVLVCEAEAFAPVGITKVVFTKLDEAVSFGMLVNVIRRVGKELSFITTGQEVPDHIEVGRAERLAELVLGGEVHA